MGWWQRVRTNASGKDKSLATGVALGFMAWTLMRLVDSISAYDTLEYDITNKPATLADGRAGFVYQVKTHQPRRRHHGRRAEGHDREQHGGHRLQHACGRLPLSVQPPAGGKVVECAPHVGGFNFSAPPLLAGTFAGLEVKYTRPAGVSETPHLRIVLAEGQNFRLVEAGVATTVVRNQTGILIAFLMLAAASLLMSLAVGVLPPPRTE